MLKVAQSHWLPESIDASRVLNSDSLASVVDVAAAKILKTNWYVVSNRLKINLAKGCVAKFKPVLSDPFVVSSWLLPEHHPVLLNKIYSTIKNNQSLMILDQKSKINVSIIKPRCASFWNKGLDLKPVRTPLRTFQHQRWIWQSISATSLIQHFSKWWFLNCSKWSIKVFVY